MARTFRNREPTHTTCRSPHDGIGDDVKDITTGVTTLCLAVLSGVRAGNDTTRPATQVVLRPVESGLGGHEDGVSGDDEGVENASIPLWERGRMAMSESLSISDFEAEWKDNASENQNLNDITIELCSVHDIGCQESRLAAVEINNMF